MEVQKVSSFLSLVHTIVYNIGIDSHETRWFHTNLALFLNEK
jgi:hypothetical protein